MAKVKGIGYWASVYQPNTMFSPKYQVDLIVDKDTKESLEKQGIKVVPDEDRGGFLVKFAINQFKADGTENNKPEVVDRHGEPTDVSIGNGSSLIVMYHPYEWAHSGKTGVKAVLDGVQIEKLVVYQSKETFEALPEDDADTESRDAL